MDQPDIVVNELYYQVEKHLAEYLKKRIQDIQPKGTEMDKIWVDSDMVLDIFYNNKSRFMWEIDMSTFEKIKHFTNAQGRFLWVPDTEYASKTGTLMGLDINISEKPGIRLVTVFQKSKHSKLVVLGE